MLEQKDIRKVKYQSSNTDSFQKYKSNIFHINPLFPVLKNKIITKLRKMKPQKITLKEKGWAVPGLVLSNAEPSNLRVCKKSVRDWSFGPFFLKNK